ncbi:MAG: MBL fold metallo-hydrolase [bacterium]
MKNKIFLGLIITTMVWLTIVVYYYSQADQPLAVVWLNVGQGDSLLIKAPQGQRVLIDSGPDQSVLTELARYLPWWNRQLDLIILTHAHADHLIGFNYVLDHYDVQRAIISSAGSDTESYQNFLAKLKDKQVEITVMTEPLTIDLAPCHLRLLYPLAKTVLTKNLNNSSIVSRLSCGQLDWLLTGDIENKAEEEILVSQPDLQSEFLKVAHHGSDTTTSRQWLQAVQPELAVISVGVDNHFGLPDQTVLDRLKIMDIVIWRTDQQGGLQIVSSDLQTWQIQEPKLLFF